VAEPIFFDILPKFGFAAVEAGLAKFKSATADAGKIAGESLTGGTEAALKKLQTDYTTAANTAADAARVVVRSNSQIEISTTRLAEVTAKYGETSSQAMRAALAESDARYKNAAAITAEADASTAAVAAKAKLAEASGGATAATMATGRALNTVGAVSAVAFTAAMYESAKAAGDFQQSQMRLVSSAGETAQGMKVVSDGVLQLAGQVGYSAGQLSEGMYTVESAGYRGADGLKVITAAAQGAKAENADLKKVTDGLTTSMTDFGYAPDQAALVMSKLVTAVGESKANFEEFTNSLHSVEPAAAGAHISLDDVYGSLARITQSGTSAEQATQNMADAIRHLQGPTDVQAAAMAKFGISAEDVQQKLSQRGLSGTMQYLSDTIRNQLDPAGNVSVSALNENAQAAQNAADMMTKMSPAAAATAQAFANGTMSRKEYTAAIKGSNADDQAQLTQFGALETKLDGFTSQYKNGRSLLETYAQALKEVTGDVAGYNVALQLSGPHTEEVNAAIKAVAQTTTDADGKVKGFNETQSTLNAKMADAKAAFGAAAIELGDVFIPYLTETATGLAHVGTFLAEHKAILESAVIALGAFGTTWAAVKVALAVGNTFSAIGDGITFVIGKFAAMGAASTATAGTVEASAAAMKASLAGVAITAASVIAAIAAGKFAADHLADTNKDHYFNPDGTMKGSGDQWIVDHLGPVGKFLEPAGAKTTGEAKDAATVSEVQRRIGATSGSTAAYAAAAAAATPVAPDAAPTDPNARPDITAPGSIDPEAEAAKKKAAKSPAGDKNDPVWITGGQDAKGGKDSEVYNPFAQFQTGGFTPASLVGFATTFALNQALGNPFGKLQAAGKRGETPTSPLYVSSVDVANAKTAYDKAVQQYGPDSTEAQKASARLAGTQAAVGTAGGYYNPATGGITAHPGYSSDAALLAQIPSGQYGRDKGADLTKGLGDCSSAVEDLVNLMQGHSTSGANMTTANEASWLTQHGLVPTNTPVPGALNVGFNDHHTQATLPGGTNFNWGSSAAAAAGGVNGTGAFDPAFTQHYYLPTDAAPNVTPTTVPASDTSGTGTGWPSPDNDLSDFDGGGGGQSPVFRRAPSAGIGTGVGARPGFGSPFASRGMGGGRGVGNFPSAPVFAPAPVLPGRPESPGGPLRPATIPTFGAAPAHAPTGTGYAGGAGTFAASNMAGSGIGAQGGALSGFGASHPATTPAPTPGGGRPASGGTGKGAGIGGGAIGAAESAAALAANAFAPGSGQAVQTATQLVNRAIGYAGQVAGIGISGLFETFGLNDSALADPQKSVIGRLAGGFAGAHKNADNVAGQSAPPLKPPDNQAPDGTAASGKGSGPAPGPTNNMTGKGAGSQVYIENLHHDGDGKQLASDLGKYQSGSTR
jgi:TP901 family phage tail tape measure protein